MKTPKKEMRDFFSRNALGLAAGVILGTAAMPGYAQSKRDYLIKQINTKVTCEHYQEPPHVLIIEGCRDAGENCFSNYVVVEDPCGKEPAVTYKTNIEGNLKKPVLVEEKEVDKNGILTQIHTFRHDFTIDNWTYGDSEKPNRYEIMYHAETGNGRNSETKSAIELVKEEQRAKTILNSTFSYQKILEERDGEAKQTDEIGGGLRINQPSGRVDEWFGSFGGKLQYSEDGYALESALGILNRARYRTVHGFELFPLLPYISVETNNPFYNGKLHPVGVRFFGDEIGNGTLSAVDDLEYKIEARAHLTPELAEPAVTHLAFAGGIETFFDALGGKHVALGFIGGVESSVFLEQPTKKYAGRELAAHGSFTSGELGVKIRTKTLEKELVRMDVRVTGKADIAPLIMLEIPKVYQLTVGGEIEY